MKPNCRSCPERPSLKKGVGTAYALRVVPAYALSTTWRRFLLGPRSHSLVARTNGHPLVPAHAHAGGELRVRVAIPGPCDRKLRELTLGTTGSHLGRGFRRNRVGDKRVLVAAHWTPHAQASLLSRQESL